MTRIIKNFYLATPYGGNIHPLFHDCQRKKAVTPFFTDSGFPIIRGSRPEGDFGAPGQGKGTANGIPLPCNRGNSELQYF